MSSKELQIYEFDGFRVENGKRQLFHDGSPIPLTPKVFDTLLYLIQHKGEVVTKEDLMGAIWPGRIVEENNLSQNISTLRRVLGQGQADSRYIVTAPGQGYRFVAEVARISAEPVQQAAPLVLAVLPFENIGAGPERD
jgi:DNA-binding winged helix-turn-helix (wHTH) protein